MKTQTIVKALSFVVMICFLASCKKDSPTGAIPHSTKDLNNEELVFLQDLQKSISQPNNKSQDRSEQAENVENPMEFIAVRTIESLKYAMNIAKEQPSSAIPDKSLFLQNIQFYNAQHPFEGNFSMECSTEFQLALQEILKSSFLQSDALETIADIKIIEHAIENANFLSESQKNTHYLFAASLRYMKNFVETTDLYLGSDPIPNGLPTWEDLYANCLNDALNSWDTAPFETAWNWADLPGTMAVCAGDATWQIATR